MRETEALLRLQEIDLELMRDERTLNNMPQAKKLRAIAAAQKKLAQQLSKIVGLRKDAEMELDDNESTHLRLQEIVDEIKQKYQSGTVGYRELADLESQLTSLAKRIEKLEFKHGDLQARAEKTRAAEKNARAMGERLQEEEAAQTAALKSQAGEIVQSMQNLKQERVAVAADISEDVRKRYAVAVKRFEGLAVESLHGNQPSVCRVTIPPSSYADIARSSQIAECPYCHRMLVNLNASEADE